MGIIVRTLAILGTRGVPAQHGGFETFAEYLSVYLVKKGWEVTVYCQEDDPSKEIVEDVWEGVKRVTIPVSAQGALGTMQFDWLSIKHAMNAGHKFVLTLGYNTASFCFLYRPRGIVNLINMDGIEWKRDKWRFPEKAWLWLNERLGCILGNHLVADHPEIAKHLATRVSAEKITMIPYGARKVVSADVNILSRFGLEPGKYAILIARAEPENSVLESVKAFSTCPREEKFVILGNYDTENNPYHKAVKEAASANVLFTGAIYEKEVVDVLRFYARFYFHGHTVGGTNPSLVEALGAGAPVLAHDNLFNRWVADDAGLYFSDVEQCALAMDNLFKDNVLVSTLRKASAKRFEQHFTWDIILREYETLLERFYPNQASQSSS